MPWEKGTHQGGLKGRENRLDRSVDRCSSHRRDDGLAAFQAAPVLVLLTQGIGLRPQPWAPFSRPVGPAGLRCPIPFRETKPAGRLGRIHPAPRLRSDDASIPHRLSKHPLSNSGGTPAAHNSLGPRCVRIGKCRLHNGKFLRQSV